MKKLPIYIILLPFLYSAAGYLPSFIIAQYKVRKEFKEKIKSVISDKDLTIITIPNSKNSALLTWKNEHEFIYHDNLYDIVRKEVNKTYTKYYCVNDLQEEKLFSDLAKHIKEQQTEKSPSKSNKLKNQIKDYLTPDLQFNKPICSTSFFINSYLFDYHSPYEENINLPPEIV